VKHLIAPSVLGSADGIRAEYVSASPFKHACIEDFLQPEWAETLLEEFPVFDPAKAVDEFGKVGRKAVRTDMREISDHYREFYDYIRSQPFLDAMSAITGIPGLIFDTQMYGGGTHENLDGQALDAHVDFNYDQERKLHRRINLLIYLNKEWDVGWGGAIQLHSDPRDWTHDEIKTFNCTFNRCVVFETNEHSWHGFRQIRLPESKRGLTRKCISIYLYTRERPAAEIVPVHGTFYVQRPLPEIYVPGRILTDEDRKEFKQLLVERDDWVAFYQRMDQEVSKENRALRTYATDLALNDHTERLLDWLPWGTKLIRPLRKSIALCLHAKNKLARSGASPLEQVSLPSLPDSLISGHVLDKDDVRGLKDLLMERDALIKSYQQRELDLRRENDALHACIAALLARVRVKVSGGLRRGSGGVQGAYQGGWVTPRLAIPLRATKSLRAMVVDGWIPPAYPADMRVEARIARQPTATVIPVPDQPFALRLEFPQPLSGNFTLEVNTLFTTPRPSHGEDQRDLAFVLRGIRGEG